MLSNNIAITKHSYDCLLRFSLSSHMTCVFLFFFEGGWGGGGCYYLLSDITNLNVMQKKSVIYLTIT